MKGMHFKSEIAQRELSDLRSQTLHSLAYSSKRLRPAISAAFAAMRILRPAERVGFEPTVAVRPTTVFETAPFVHSGTSPINVSVASVTCSSKLALGTSHFDWSRIIANTPKFPPRISTPGNASAPCPPPPSSPARASAARCSPCTRKICFTRALHRLGVFHKKPCPACAESPPIVTTSARRSYTSPKIFTCFSRRPAAAPGCRAPATRRSGSCCGRSRYCSSGGAGCAPSPPCPRPR